jgi:hypothetical protein
MTIWTEQSGRDQNDGEDFQELARFERITHRRDGDCPVRSHMSRTRARMRSRSGPAARRKSREYHGAHRRLRAFA